LARFAECSDWLQVGSVKAGPKVAAIPLRGGIVPSDWRIGEGVSRRHMPGLERRRCVKLHGAGNGVDVGVQRQPQDGLHRHESEYGLSEFDTQHRFVASAVWYLPYGRDRRYGAHAARALNMMLGAWEFSPIATAQTGLGLTVTQGCSFNLGGEVTCRPNRLTNGALPENVRSVDNWIDASAFQILQLNPAQPGFTPNQVFGNSDVGILRGPKLFNIDFNLSKNFALNERHSVQFRAEFFNALNHPNFSVPGTNLSAGFGQITSNRAQI